MLGAVKQRDPRLFDYISTMRVKDTSKSPIEDESMLVQAQFKAEARHNDLLLLGSNQHSDSEQHIPSSRALDDKQSDGSVSVPPKLSKSNQEKEKGVPAH
jgi:hypothetical protein